MRARTHSRRIRTASILVAATFALTAAGCGQSKDNAVVVTETAPVAEMPTQSVAVAPRKDKSELPPDGQQLFDFLLKEIPALVEKVPCSCCSKVIGECYRGACPTTCGPCNKIGRDAYTWHKSGIADDDIVARVKSKYNINR